MTKVSPDGSGSTDMGGGAPLSRSRELPVSIAASGFTIEGKSIAGNESWFRVGELGLALDIGRCPDLLVPTPHVLITHAHLDHSLGIPFYAAQRKLQSLPAGTICLPAENVELTRELIRVHERLQGSRYDLQLLGFTAGESFSPRRDLRVRAHDATHTIPARAWEVLELRRKLRPEYRDSEGEEIRRIRASGVSVTDEEEASLLFYTGDTDREIFDRSPALFGSRVLIIECSFVQPDDRDRADRYRHIHADDLWARAEQFENELILLTHFSLRDSPEQTRGMISARCPEVLRDRIRLAFPAPHDRL